MPTCRTLVIMCDNGAIWRHQQIWKTMKFFHDNFLLCVSFVSLFVIITAEDHVRGVPFPLGMLRLNNAACSKFPASRTKCKRVNSSHGTSDRPALAGLLSASACAPLCAPRGAHVGLQTHRPTFHPPLTLT